MTQPQIHAHGANSQGRISSCSCYRCCRLDIRLSCRIRSASSTPSYTPSFVPTSICSPSRFLSCPTRALEEHDGPVTDITKRVLQIAHAHTQGLTTSLLVRLRGLSRLQMGATGSSSPKAYLATMFFARMELRRCGPKHLPSLSTI